jgi:hypothetical protein
LVIIDQKNLFVSYFVAIATWTQLVNCAARKNADPAPPQYGDIEG